MSTPEEIDTTLYTAIEAGYRHIDTAYSYQNETAIGASLAKIFSRGKIKREDMFIVTKLPMIGNRAEDVEVFLKKSLENLQLDYIDLYLIHIPVGMVNKGFDEIFPKDENGRLLIDHSTNILEIWRAMEAQVDAGRTKSIGLSNFNQSQIKRVLDNCCIPPVNLQVEIHIYLQQKELVSFCKQNGVTVCAYSPLGSPSYREFMEERGYSMEGARILHPMEDPAINKIAEKYKKQPSHILLRYLMEYGVAVIPKSTNPSRIKQNINVFDFELTKEEFERISALDRGEEGRMFGGRGNEGIVNLMESHPEYPFPK
ncbi:dihydrodiol dehydrogenase 3 isoform X2 [Halyomorpha halys]|uniref:dihydrodiol dehydrogenase 3 isoform X2 n=1 Tax=Halyomorpha halys TaxID=286706 RepID=UPI0006D4F9D0|nr:dihydrodiol dehydrogenase 3 isoform X2 [Halyomorpha halys]